MGLQTRESVEFISILGSDGTLRLKVSEDTPGAVRREGKDSKDQPFVKYELVFASINGIITDLALHEGEFGTNIIVTFKDGDQENKLSLNSASPFGEDFMKKLPSIDLTKEVVLAPFSFVDNKGKTRKGVTITQDGKKLTNFFYDAEKEKNVHGYPEPKGDTSKYSKDKWKLYFNECRVFLIDYTTEHFVSKGSTELN